MKRSGRGALRPLQGLGALVLALCSGAAAALGLGDIRVLSGPGQPLVAEIPVISNEPGELESARVALASPETFERVGLERPTGLVNDLQFQFTQDARGRAVIRVTSSVPVEQKAIGFLIEVDWGSGRLVREYSALVDAPNAATAIAEPAIEAPQAGNSDAIVRESAPAAAPSDAAAAASAAAPAAPAARPQRPPPAALVSPVAPGENLAPVRRGQTLSQIAMQLNRGAGYSLDQTMLALLRANPEAFIGGNINRLKQGAVLRTPRQDELAQIGASEARAIVREQAAQWRQARAPIPQPAEAGATPRAASAAPAAATGARLEIAPAVASDGNKAGTTTGTGAGGEGDRLVNEQLQQAREDVATRDAEIQELRTRVAELEKLQQQQARLIAMKDTDLAAAQQRLAQQRPADESGGFPMWLWGGVVLVLAGIAAWLASRRRKPSPFAAPPRRFDGAAFGATTTAPTAVQDEPVIGEREFDHDVEIEEASLRADERIARSEEPEAPVAEAPQPLEERPLPAAWGPTWHAPEAPSIAPLNPAPAGRDRLELAVAYLDLGDKETARSLLLEVAASGDPDARAEASALLSRIG
ncbi:type IV pilus assembly protein FimV [[Pseudomonas] boreopolis]|uniref:type IV pilus assembly protein FimV n=1 Tax=Xanthomonas boreopolis TaxID=86183 RepID=UPI003D9AFBFD